MKLFLIKFNAGHSFLCSLSVHTRTWDERPTNAVCIFPNTGDKQLAGTAQWPWCTSKLLLLLKFSYKTLLFLQCAHTIHSFPQIGSLWIFWKFNLLFIQLPSVVSTSSVRFQSHTYFLWRYRAILLRMIGMHLDCVREGNEKPKQHRHWIRGLFQYMDIFNKISGRHQHIQE